MWHMHIAMSLNDGNPWCRGGTTASCIYFVLLRLRDGSFPT